MKPERWWLADCRACDEKTLSEQGEGPCPFCGEAGQVTFTPDPTPRAVAAQEQVSGVLWRVAQCGPPQDERGHVRPEYLAAAGAALKEILGAFGYEVTPIQ